MAEPTGKETKTEVEQASELLFGGYHRYACEGESALEYLSTVRTVYETVVIAEAEHVESVEPDTGADFLFTQGLIRRGQLLSIASPDRHKGQADFFQLVLLSGLGAGMIGNVIPHGEYLAYLYAATKYADKRETYRGGHFAGLLDQYYSGNDFTDLSFKGLISSALDTEIRFIKEVVKPEIDARRRRVLGRTAVVGAGLTALKSLNIIQ